jgi:hypothetical protein
MRAPRYFGIAPDPAIMWSMSAKEALAQAQELWGRDAAICNDEIDGTMVRLVGVLVEWSFAIRGRGETWEAAFRDAEREPKAEMFKLG